MVKVVVLIALLTCSTSFGQCDNSCKCGMVSTKQSKVVLVPTTISTPVSIPQAQAQSQFGIKSPVGHTHTCVNGHTWDHSITSGHNCPVCGVTQFVQDSQPRQVSTVRTATPQVQYSFPAQSGCANGQCPTSYSQTRQGFFRK